MTVETTNITSGPYTGNGLSDEYDYDFRVDNKNQLIVYETDDDGVQTTLTVDTDYTVGGVGVDEGGTITRVAGNLPTGYKWYIRSNYQATQETDFASQGGFFPRIHARAFDKLTFLVQQLTDRISRSLRFSDSYSGNADTSLDAPVAGAYIRWNNDGSKLINDSDISTIITISGAVTAVAAIADEVVAVAGNATNINTVVDNLSAIIAAPTAAQNAQDAAELAYEWANNPEDVPVSGGEFSAYHWAQKAQEAATLPDPGIAVSTGTAWDNSLTAPDGDLVGTEGEQTLSNKTLDDPILTLDGSEGTAGQVPVSQGAGLPPVWGDVGGGSQFDFIADGAITAGKAVILKSNGKVAQSAIAAASVGSAVDLSGNNASAVSTCYDPVNDKFVVFYCDTSDGSKGKAVVGTVSGSTVSFGTPVTFYTGSIDSGGFSLSSCFDPVTGQIIVAYRSSSSDARLRTCTVSGTTVSFGTEIVPVTSGNQSVSVCYDISVSRVLLSYFVSTTPRGRVITVSGSSLSAGSEETFSGIGSSGIGNGVTHCTDYGTPGTNAIAWAAGGVSYMSFVRIDPTTYALSQVQRTQVDTNQGGGQGCYGIAWAKSVQRAVVLFVNNSSTTNALSVRMYQLSGTSITAGANTQVDGSSFLTYQNFASIACSPDGESICVTYPDPGSSYFGKMLFTSTLLSNSIAFGPELQYQSNNVGWTSVAYNSSGKTLVGYSVTSGLGRAAVGTAPIPDSRTSFIGFAENTVANGQTVTVTTPFGVNENQSGLTPNTNYFLSSSDGSTLTTTVNGPRVGKALSATELLVLGSNVYQV